MRIKTLELQGFKSFPDKTVVNFDHGVTVIVGPNGSGKSNLSDAIRWVLGEISSKNIRGSKMEDVIFGGTDTRRQMGFAEVSFTIDNTDKSNRMNIDYDEITVTRRYYRTGESEYLINGQQVRLKDIAELFMNTGIGRTGYSIIGQGRIAEIISQKSEDRRLIFEEAAGISKYRYKKKEAERKLTQTNENLLRVTDILAELEGRVGPLEKDAAKARAYLDMYDEKKQADISLWLYDIAAVRAEYDHTDAAYTVAGQELAIVDDQLAALETRNDALYLEAQAAKAKREHTENAIRELNERHHALFSSGKVLENDVAHIASQIDASEKDLALIRSRLTALADRRAENTAMIQTQKKQLAKIDAQFRAQGAELEQIRADVFTAQTAREELETAVRENDGALIALRATLTSFHEAAPRDTSEETLAERTQCEERITLLQNRIDHARTAISDYQKRIDEIKADAALSDQYAAKEAQIAEMHHDKEQLSLRIGVLEQRYQTLQRMAEHFEGYSHSVKTVMEAAGSGALSGVYGTVSDLIETDVRYALAIETALGSQVQNIVVDTDATAKKAIALLKEQRAGKATFLPVSTITAQPLNADTDTIEACGGFVGYADELVGRDSRYDEIVRALLGRTVVFDDLDHAILMERKIGYKIRCVTLDGQQINAGGSFTGGSVKKDSGILSRAAQADALRTETAGYKSRLGALEKSIADEQAVLTKLKNKLDEQNASTSLLNTLMTAEDTQMQVLIAQLENEQAQLSHLDAQIAADKENQNAREKQIETLNGQIADGRAVLTKLDVDLEAAKEKCEELDRTLAGALEQKNALLVDIAAAEKDVALAERELQNTDGQIAAEKEALDRTEIQLTALKDSLQKKKQKIKENEQVQATSSDQLTALRAEEEALRETIDQLDRKVGELRTLFMDKTHERELKFREHTNLEHKRAQILARQESMSGKIWDEYELSYTAACESGYPEVTAENRAQVAAKAQEFKAKMRALGNVNVGAIEEYAQVKERYDFLSGQVNDLNTSRDDLTGIIHKLESEMKHQFARSFDEINTQFKTVFRELFGGGSANLELSDPENILESGIEINVAPPGKIIKNLQLLSGGEQVFVAIALYFAILKVNPAPFCLLDEIEAALDEVNVTKFAEYAKKYSNKTQFIIITHRRGTMEVADTLYGVTMQERGISKILSINVGEAEKKLGMKVT